MSTLAFDHFYPLGPQPLGFIACSPSCNPAPAESLAAPAVVQSRASIPFNGALRTRLRADRKARVEELGQLWRALPKGGPHAERSMGAYVLMAHQNVLAGYIDGGSTYLDRLEALRCHAADCIGVGC